MKRQDQRAVASFSCGAVLKEAGMTAIARRVRSGFPEARLIRYNPAVVPCEWMNQFWLADLRPRHEAQLVEADAATSPQALRRTAHGDAAMVVFAEIGTTLGPHLRAVTLTGAAPVLFLRRIPACRPARRRPRPLGSLPDT
jgi:hypothetical protein